MKANADEIDRVANETSGCERSQLLYNAYCTANAASRSRMHIPADNAKVVMDQGDITNAIASTCSASRVDHEGHVDTPMMTTTTTAEVVDPLYMSDNPEDTPDDDTRHADAPSEPPDASESEAMM